MEKIELLSFELRQIAATAQRHQLTVVTRNATDFAKTGMKLLNPFA